MNGDVLLVFAQSLLIGASIAAPVGQIGVLAITRTLQQGRAAGLATGLGAAVADAVYGGIGAFGAATLIAWLVGMKTAFALAGAAVLLWLAWKIATQPPTARAAAAPSARSLAQLFAGTFVLTLSNPTTVLSFLAVFGGLAARAPTASPWAMVAGVLLGSAAWWLLLASVVDRLRERFDARWHRAVNRVSALVLAGFAAWQLAGAVAAP